MTTLTDTTYEFTHALCGAEGVVWPRGSTLASAHLEQTFGHRIGLGCIGCRLHYLSAGKPEPRCQSWHRARKRRAAYYFMVISS